MWIFKHYCNNILSIVGVLNKKLLNMGSIESWPNNPFWDFSVDFYGREGVQERLIRLQESLKIDINVMLYCYWAAYIGEPILTESQIENAVMRVKVWQKETVLPLREVRNKLKQYSCMDYSVWFDEVRNKVIAAELEAERLEQLILYNQQELKGRQQITSLEKRNRAKGNVTVYFKYGCQKINPETEKILDWLLNKLFDKN